MTTIFKEAQKYSFLLHLHEIVKWLYIFIAVYLCDCLLVNTYIFFILCPVFVHPGRGKVGQNLAYGHQNWKAAIDAWHSEVSDFNYDGTPSGVVGHYTAVIVYTVFTSSS